MPRLISLISLALIALLAALYASGADRALTQWALSGQRAAQDAMAGGLRALRAGEGAALAGFLLVCFSYGFFHAAGPGHGKLLIGGYGAARAVGAWRLSSMALIASLAQGLSAVALVGAGVWIWQLGRAQMTDLADRLLAPLSFGAIALIGLWLVWRCLVRLRAAVQPCSIITTTITITITSTGQTAPHAAMPICPILQISRPRPAGATWRC